MHYLEPVVVHVEDEVLSHDGQPDEGDVGHGLGIGVGHLVAFDCALEGCKSLIVKLDRCKVTLSNDSRIFNHNIHFDNK